MAKKQEVDVLAELQGSPIGCFIECMISGEFADSPSRSVGENEVVVGELSFFEKALLTTRNNFSQSAREIAEQHNSAVDELKEKGEIPSMVDVQKAKASHEFADKMADGFDSLLWGAIGQRLFVDTVEGGGMGICRDYKIVRIPEGEKSGINIVDMSGGMSGILSEMFSGLLDPDRECDCPDCAAKRANATPTQ